MEGIGPKWNEVALMHQTIPCWREELLPEIPPPRNLLPICWVPSLAGHPPHWPRPLRPGLASPVPKSLSSATIVDRPPSWASQRRLSVLLVPPQASGRGQGFRPAANPACPAIILSGTWTCPSSCQAPTRACTKTQSAPFHSWCNAWWS